MGARTAVPALLVHLEKNIASDFEDEIIPTSDILDSLASIGPEAVTAVPTLIKMLPRMWPDIGKDVVNFSGKNYKSPAHALSCIGPAARVAVPKLFAADKQFALKTIESWRLQGAHLLAAVFAACLSTLGMIVIFREAMWSRLSDPARSAVVAVLGAATAFAYGATVHHVSGVITTVIHANLQSDRVVYLIALPTFSFIGGPLACILLVNLLVGFGPQKWQGRLVIFAAIIGPLMYWQFGSVGVRATVAVILGMAGGAFLVWLTRRCVEINGGVCTAGVFAGTLAGGFTGWFDPAFAPMVWGAFGVFLALDLHDRNRSISPIRPV